VVLVFGKVLAGLTHSIKLVRVPAQPIEHALIDSSLAFAAHESLKHISSGDHVLQIFKRVCRIVGVRPDGAAGIEPFGFHSMSEPLLFSVRL
jgi:hypothetical protein